MTSPLRRAAFSNRCSTPGAPDKSFELDILKPISIKRSNRNGPAKSDVQPAVTAPRHQQANYNWLGQMYIVEIDSDGSTD
jgi:hypothetical protein